MPVETEKMARHDSVQLLKPEQSAVEIPKHSQSQPRAGRAATGASQKPEECRYGNRD